MHGHPTSPGYSLFSSNSLLPHTRKSGKWAHVICGEGCEVIQKEKTRVVKEYPRGRRRLAKAWPMWPIFFL
jgi:hypothetical protein